jgi:multidrug transporter EmrE-like cation transporter
LNTLANALGLIGVFLVLLMYFLLQLDKIEPKKPAYSIVNACGSVLILVSLYFYFNLSSAVIETAWLAISLFGIYRGFRA